jgi:hypothetical protein
MSAAGEECSFWMHTDDYIGCAVAADSISMDINDNDDQSVGCAIARATRAEFLSNSDSEDISDKDYDSSCAETCYPVGLKSDGGGKGSLLVKLVGSFNFWFQYLGPPLEVEFRFCF